MDFNEYQALATRTTSPKTDAGHIDCGCKGLCGESGELIDILKKHDHQGHPLNKPHMIEELGDVLWYCAELATGLGVTLNDVAQMNVDKLKARFPDGFSVERSLNRNVIPAQSAPTWEPDERD